PVSAMACAAIAASVVTPTSGLPSATRSPRMKASPTRWPVKVPGPVVTARRSRAEKASSAWRIASSTIGARISAWPRSIGSKMCASTSSPSRMATEQAPSAVSTASSLMSENLARFVESEPGMAGEDARRIAMADAAEEVRFHPRAREEFRIHLGIVEARHRAAIEPERACGDNEIGALQRAVAESCDLFDVRMGEPGLCRLIVREELRQLFGEVEIVADDRGCRCRTDFRCVAGRRKAREPLFRLWRRQEQKARRRAIGAGRAHPQQVVARHQPRDADRPVRPLVLRARGAE